MEKILLSNRETLEIYGISTEGDALTINFIDQDMAALEIVFENASALEKIILQDASGEAMAAFKHYAIFKEIKKEKNVIINDISDETADIITITLVKEPEWMVSQRQQDARISSVEETTDTLVMEALI